MRDIGAAKSDNAKMGNSALSQDVCLPVLASEHGLRCGLLYIHCGLQIVSGMAITLSNSPLCVCTYTPHVYFPEMCYKMAIVPVVYRTAGNFRGRKLLQILRFCGYLQNFFCKIWRRGIFCRHKWAIHSHCTSSIYGASPAGTTAVGPMLEANLWISLRAGCRSSDSAIIFHT